MTKLLQDYDYVLPPDSIAQVPASPRDTAKMLDCSGAILQDRQICDLPDIVRPGDLIIVNDTRVLRAQLTGYRGIGKIRFTLHKRASDSVWHAFAKPAKKCTPGTEIRFSDDLHATITQHPGHHLEAPVVAIQPQLGQNNPQRRLIHHTTARST